VTGLYVTDKRKKGTQGCSETPTPYRSQLSRKEERRDDLRRMKGESEKRKDIT